MTDSFGVLHLLHDSRIRQDLVKTVEITVGALGKHDLIQPLGLALIVFLLKLSLDESEKLVIEEARAGDDEALDTLEVERGDDVVTLLEEFVE